MLIKYLEKKNMPDSTKINKTITEIRRENYETDKILRDLWFLLDLDHYKITMNLKKLLVFLIVIIFNMKVLWDKDK